MQLHAALLTLPIMAFSLSAQANSQSCDTRVNNTHNKLQECVTVEGVRQHQNMLQAIADANGGNRTAGTDGYNQSAYYVHDTLVEAGYDVQLQSFNVDVFYTSGASAFEQLAPVYQNFIEGADFSPMGQTAPGDVTAPVQGVTLELGLGNASTSGCDPTDFGGFTAGNIALLQRGGCNFQFKAENAEAAGATGVIIFNQGNTASRRGLIGGTLTTAYTGSLPVVETTYAIGEALASTPGAIARIFTNVFNDEVETYNVIAQSTAGDPQNIIMAGAHLDSVPAGPGIQDNGSGSAALLEVALQMAKVTPRNQVRFAWWGAEELGLRGSSYYLDTLAQDARDAISVYLNFDMIASPNFVYFVLDSDASDSPGVTVPESAGEVEALFERYYAGRGLPAKTATLTGTSDYAPFVFYGIPVGGLFTGAAGIKSLEEALLWGGVEGELYDPCYHLACDTYDNVSLEALDTNADAMAYAILQFSMNTSQINDEKSKGNFKRSDTFEYVEKHIAN